jgi:ribonucleoside-triphosphate reductase
MTKYEKEVIIMTTEVESRPKVKTTKIEKLIAPHSFQEEFVECLAGLEREFGFDLFQISGIGKQLDVNWFAKNFFSKPSNTADVSVDSNSNVGLKNTIVFDYEMVKPLKLIYSYYRMWKGMKKKYGLDYANEAIRKQITGEIYINDFHGWASNLYYCYNYSTLDTARNGIPKGIDAEMSHPTKYLNTFMEHLQLFCVHAGASSLGAVGLADLLLTISCYVKRILTTHTDQHVPFGNKIWDEVDAIIGDDWGHVSDEKMALIKDLINSKDVEEVKFSSDEACWTFIREKLCNFIYFLNQPNRLIQSLFSNVSIYDDNFLDTLLDFYYIEADGEMYFAEKDIVKRLQEIFMEVMNETMSRRITTFPVVTACSSLDENRKLKQRDFLRWVLEADKQYRFVNLYGGATSTLSSCCRLRSDKTNKYFSTLGSGGTKIGSLGVCTQNLPRLAFMSNGSVDTFKDLLRENIILSQRINNEKRRIIKKAIDKKAIPLYNLGYTLLETQYSTTGVVGIYEALEILGYDIKTPEGQDLAEEILKWITEVTDEVADELKAPCNVEQIPAENVAVKLAKKDKYLGYNDKYEIYSNQYVPLKDNDADLFTRIGLVARLDKYMSGGSILHININEPDVDTDTLLDLAESMYEQGVVYFAFNKLLAECKECNKVFTTTKDKFDANEVVCPECGSHETECALRIVGFIRKFSSWSSERQAEGRQRKFYSNFVTGD